MARIELLDPFGQVMGEGELILRDVPGVDEHTPSVADEFRQRFAGQRLLIETPLAPHPGARYSIRVGD